MECSLSLKELVEADYLKQTESQIIGCCYYIIYLRCSQWENTIDGSTDVDKDREE
jgi:hypothetical protein